MDPLEFLEVATRYSQSKRECETRTSVGRSYYAVFNHLRLRLGEIKPLPTTADAHAYVVRYLSGAPNPDLRSIAQTLKDLRESRNKADYDLSTSVGDDLSRAALLRANRAIQKSQGVSPATLKAAIGAMATIRGPIR
jgi:hypothetical protein